MGAHTLEKMEGGRKKENMLWLDIIELSCLIMLVLKANGSMGFCANYRELNKMAQFNKYPMLIY